MSVIKLLFQSRKFCLMLADILVSVITYFTTKYISPEVAKDVMFMVKVMQPAVIFVIIGITVEDAARKLGGGASY